MFTWLFPTMIYNYFQSHCLQCTSLLWICCVPYRNVNRQGFPIIIIFSSKTINIKIFKNTSLIFFTGPSWASKFCQPFKYFNNYGKCYKSEEIEFMFKVSSNFHSFYVNTSFLFLIFFGLCFLMKFIMAIIFSEWLQRSRFISPWCICHP